MIMNDETDMYKTDITALNDSPWVIIAARNDREEDCMNE